MGDLKRFSDIIYGPTIVVHSSNNVSWQPPTPECENRAKGGVASHVTPRNVWALNANISKTAEGTKFKFGRRVPRDSPDMTPDKYFRKVGVVTVT